MTPCQTRRMRNAVHAALAFLVCATAAADQAGVDPADLTGGLTLRVYQVQTPLDYLPRLVENQTPNVDRLVSSIDLRDRRAFGDVPAKFYSTLSGYVQIEKAGEYTFRLASDDGSRLVLDGKTLIDNDGRPGATPRQSAAVRLEAGLHPLLIEHFDGGGRTWLRLEWRAPGATDFSALPAEVLRTENDPTRVTSPGFKRVSEGRRPGDGRPLDSVHPGWAVQSINVPGFDPMIGAMTCLPDGRLVVGTFAPVQRDNRSLPDIDKKVPDKLYALSNLTGDFSNVKMQVVADNLFEPTGLCVADGALYVAHRKAVTRLLDRDGDGFFETHEDVGGGWDAWNYHQFTLGLLHRDGKLYTALSTAMAPPDWEGMGTNSAPNGPMRGGVIEIDLSSNDTRVIVGGTRTPNGLGFGPEGSMFYLDNQGTWMPTSQLAEVIPGRFYGHHNRTNFVPKLAERYPNGGAPSALGDRPRTSAAIYLPHGEISNSPTQPLLIESGPFAGQMYLGELTGGGIRRASLERVNGQWQGAVFRFTQGLSCGVNRLAPGPEGSLYVGGIGALGNWNWNGKRSGLQRLTPTGQSVFEYHSLSATPDGFVVRFTAPVDEAWLSNVSNYQLSTWRYRPTADYGGEKVDEKPLFVRRATPMESGRAVKLEIDGLGEGQVVYLRADPKSAAGEPIWSTEAWYTLNQIPAPEPTASATIAGAKVDVSSGVGVGVLPPADGVPVISASADANFRRGGKASTATARSDEDLQRLPGYVEVGGGDLESTLRFGDARLHIEFYCPPGGEGQLAANSGIYLQGLYELQVLGTKPDAKPKNNELGAIYQQKAPDLNASTGPGTWQAYDIWFRAPRFQDGKKTANARATIYLNGKLIHNDLEIPSPTGNKARDGEPGGEPVQFGPLLLQDHETRAEGPVRYRNVWISPLEVKSFAEGEWKPLFDGKTLEGWLTRGGEARYEVAGEANNEPAHIVGTTAPTTPNTFLVTERTFRDFELLLEFKQHADLNSGIQIRSRVEGGIGNRGGKVLGYQVDLDPSPRAYTGGLYDEAGRGWLHTLVDAPYARSAYKAGEWNRLRIVAKGPIVQTWINGIPAATVFDAVDAEGHIGLQVHGVGDRSNPLTVQWRNLRIRELKQQ